MENNKRKAEPQEAEDKPLIIYDFECDINGCTQSFKFRVQLKWHRAEHRNENNEYNCDLCPYKSKHARSIQNHRRTHTLERPFMCDVCGKSYISKLSLLCHMLIHNDDSKKYICNFEGCTYAAVIPSLLKRHHISHLEEKPFKCIENGCTSSFPDKCSLIRHQILHSFAYPYKCVINDCEYKFKYNESLQLHINNIHRGIMFECQELNCGKKYKLQCSLYRHMNEFHLKTEEYKCDECDQTFVRTTSLEQHRSTIHLGEKRYKCDHCRFVTNYKDYLKIHTALHEKQQFYQFPCPMQDGGTQEYSQGDVSCSTRCNTQLDLEYHIERNHTPIGLGNKYESETKLSDFLKQKGIEFTRDRQNTINFTNCSNIEANKKSARPDFYLICKSVELKCVFFLENDEFAHRQSACDFQRLYNIIISLRQESNEMLPIVFLRFNPHHFKLDGVYHNMSLKDGHEKLYKVIQSITPEHLKHDINLVYINYDHTDGRLDVFNEDEINDYADLFEKYIILDV